jgi:nucleoside 2-deoxyribosyltransferase
LTVYLSGPISGIPDYRERFAQAARYIEHLGSFEVINPAATIERPEWDWSDWMLYDLALMTKADVLVTLPGSERSPGATVERAFALGLGIPVVDLAEARAWVATIAPRRAH